MNETKNIERLFKEKFKNFEASPPEDTWQGIQSKMIQKKNKRKGIPFWLPYASVAVLGFVMGTVFWNSMDNEFLNQNSKINSNNKIETKKPQQKQEVVTTISNSGKNVLDTITKVKERSSLKTKPEILLKSTNVITHKKHTKFNEPVNQIFEKNKKSFNNDLFDQKKSETSVENSELISILEPQNNTFQKSFDPKNSLGLEKTDENWSKNLKKNNALSAKDSTNLVLGSTQKLKTDLEQLLEKKVVGKNADEKEKETKWAISTMASPVFFNSMIEGSSIDDMFTENEKSFITTMSYGVGITYELSQKIKLRTGVQSIGLDYTTNDVSFQSSIKSVENNIPALSRNANSDNLFFIDKRTSTVASMSDVENFNQTNVAALSQKTQYIEVPIEISYALWQSKLQIDVIGGMSTFYLSQNDLFLIENGMEMNIGSAANLNTIHFSTNIGFGMKYPIFKNVEAAVQPMFKYQLNTYKSNDTNFRPYFFGVYSGVVYRF